MNIHNNSETFKEAVDFILIGSVTRTCEIKGITQAGIPGKIPYTSTLDAEFITTGDVFSMPDIAETPKGVPTPALITRAVHELKPFASMTIVNAGLTVFPQGCDVKLFGLTASEAINKGANIDAKDVFEKGMKFGKFCLTKKGSIIVGESTPSGTTTAMATAKALGIKVEGLFASSFKEAPSSLKEEVVNASYALLNDEMSTFEKLGIVSDNMLIFTAGFVIEASKRMKVTLAGGTQMATALHVMQTLAKELNLEYEAKNIELITTKWLALDVNSNIDKLINKLQPSITASYADFDFSLSEHPALKLYDEGEAKEGVGAGACLAYAFAKGITQEQITRKVESYLG